MLQNIDIKLVFSVVASVIAIVFYYPYIRDIFLKKTKPHIYTWLIWSITMGTATMGVLKGDGNFGTISIGILTLLVTFVLVLSIKYGTKNITKNDTAVLILALLSVIVWWQLDNPVLAIIMVSMIDGLGYIPTYRKSWQNPYEETFSFWIAMIIVFMLTLLSTAEYNLLTVTYVITTIVANSILVSILFFRRKVVTKE